jgi:hypothetical protein
MSLKEAERLAARIQREMGGGPTTDWEWADIIDNGDGTFSVWLRGNQQFFCVEEWEEFSRREYDGWEVEV